MTNRSGTTPLIEAPKTRYLTAVKTRPTTQYGLKDPLPPKSSLLLPPSSRAKSRTVKDKRFYIQMMQAQMNLIREEIVNLRKEASNSFSVAINKNELKRTAEVTAKRFAENQELLSVYNTALDFHMAHNTPTDIEEETKKLNEKNKFVEEELDHVQTLVIRRDKIYEKLKDQMKCFENEETEVLESIPQSERENYSAMFLKNKEYLEKISEEHRLIENERKIIDRLKTAIGNSKLKETKLKLLQCYASCVQDRQAYGNDLEQILSPNEEKARLLEQLKKDKSDIKLLSSMRVQLNEEIKTKSEEAAEEEPEAVVKKRMEKLKEFKKREEMMLDFIASSEDKISKLKTRIIDLQNIITESLSIMKENTICEVDPTQLYPSFDEVSEEELKNQYRSFQKRLKKLDALRESNEKEIERLRKEISDMQEEKESFLDIDSKVNVLQTELKEAKSKHKFLKNKLESGGVDIQEMEREESFLDEKLNKNAFYTKLLNLEKEITNVEEEIVSLENELVENNYSETGIEDKLNEVKKVVARYNSSLQMELKRNAYGKSISIQH